LSSPLQHGNACFCGQSSWRSGPSYDAQFGLVRLVRCSGCGAFRAAELPSPEDLERLYASDMIYRPPTVERFQEQKRRFAYLGKKLASLGHSGGRILEVGCSAGYALAALEDAGWQTTGVEANVGTADFARAQLRGQILADISEIPADSQFDAVLLSHILEHIVDPRAFLAALSAHLAPNGVVFILVPNYGSTVVRYFVGSRWESFLPLQHVWYFDAGSLTNLLALEGFSVAWIEAAGCLSFRSTNMVKAVLKAPLVAYQHAIPGQGFELRGVFRRATQPR
jgi:SAM-dependent methyltransferase